VDLGLKGKVGLVTGGSRGIGRAIALSLATEGVRVGICGRTDETIQRTLTELRALNVAAHGVMADVTCPGEVERFVEDSAAELGGVDLLVANVGGSAGQELLASTPEDWTTAPTSLSTARRVDRAPSEPSRCRQASPLAK
jgi:3-oxoacyl-[acyl-carrier protein] reductase